MPKELKWLREIANSLHTTPNFNFIGELLSNDRKTLLILDLDDTIQQSSQYFGCDHWFESYLKQTGDLQKTVALYNKIQQSSTFKLLEPRIAKLISSWQEQYQENLTIVGLTARSKILANSTTESMAKLNIKFSSLFKKHNNTYLIDHTARIFIKDSIIFCSGQQKGICLNLALSSLVDLPFDKFIIVDDKEPNVRCVMSSLLEFGILRSSVCGVHYNFSQHYYYPLRNLQYLSLQSIGQIQEEHFEKAGELLSDDNALMEKKCK